MGHVNSENVLCQIWPVWTYMNWSVNADNGIDPCYCILSSVSHLKRTWVMSPLVKRFLSDGSEPLKRMLQSHSSLQRFLVAFRAESAASPMQWDPLFQLGLHVLILALDQVALDACLHSLVTMLSYLLSCYMIGMLSYLQKQKEKVGI